MLFDLNDSTAIEVITTYLRQHSCPAKVSALIVTAAYPRFSNEKSGVLFFKKITPRALLCNRGV